MLRNRPCVEEKPPTEFDKFSGVDVWVFIDFKWGITGQRCGGREKSTDVAGLRVGASIATDLQKIPIQPELFIGHKVSKKQSTET